VNIITDAISGSVRAAFTKFGVVFALIRCTNAAIFTRLCSVHTPEDGCSPVSLRLRLFLHIKRNFSSSFLVDFEKGILRIKTTSSEQSQTQSGQSARLPLQSSELAPPRPHPQASVAPPLWFQGGTRWGELIRTKGQTLWQSRYGIVSIPSQNSRRE
jgi:hypothetical protein